MSEGNEESVPDTSEMETAETTRMLLVSDLLLKIVLSSLGTELSPEKAAAVIPDFIQRDDEYFRQLLGISASHVCPKDVTSSCFDQLPVGIMEMIFCQLPFTDLLNFRLVCRVWNEIISHEKLMQWKKAYYKLKLGNEVAGCLKTSVSKIKASEIKECVPSLIKFMAHKFSQHAIPDVSLVALPKYQLALDVLKERFPDIKPEKRNVWCITTLLVILSESVAEVHNILRYLLKSPLSVCDVFDAFYCMSTHFLYFIKHFNMNRGFHYRLYCSLFTLENTICKADKVLQKGAIPPTASKLTHQDLDQTIETELTAEQVRILNHRLAREQLVKILGFSGTGKTTTLAHFTRLYPQLKFLYVTSNENAFIKTSKLFPTNVECRTPFCLADEAIGNSYRHRLCDKLKPDAVLLYVMQGDIDVRLTFAKILLETIDNFCSSCDFTISNHHVPTAMRSFLPESFPAYSSDKNEGAFSFSTIEKICGQAMVLWEQISDKNSDIGITNEAYLKLYQLSQPRITGYDCIIADDVHDMNIPLLFALVRPKMLAIVTLDPNQTLYAHKGITLSTKPFPTQHVYHLTQSLRFGPEIAYVASSSQEVLQCDLRNTITASPNKAAYTDGTIKGQYAIICRTEFGVLVEAMRLCWRKNFLKGEPNFIQGAFVGGIENYGLGTMLEMHKIIKGSGSVEDDLLKMLGPEKLDTFSRYSGYGNFGGYIKLVNLLGDDVPKFVESLRKQCSYPVESANIVFSTVRRAKGLEFDTVGTTDDFDVCNIPAKTPVTNTNYKEELYLLYVSITRAKKCLRLSSLLSRVMLSVQENFEYPRSSKEILSNKDSIMCICGQDFKPETCLVLCQRPLTFFNRFAIDGGPECTGCVSETRTKTKVFAHEGEAAEDKFTDNYHESMSYLVGPLTSN